MSVLPTLLGSSADERATQLSRQRALLPETSDGTFPKGRGNNMAHTKALQPKCGDPVDDANAAWPHIPKP